MRKTVATLLITVLLAGTAAADSVLFNFEGVIDRRWEISPDHEDALVSGSFTWDTSTPGLPAGNHNVFIHRPVLTAPGATAVVSTTNGPELFQQDSDTHFSVYFGNDILSSSGTLYDDIQYFSRQTRTDLVVFLRFSDPSGTAFDSEITTLPTTLDFSKFGSQTFIVYEAVTGGTALQSAGHITSASSAAVPLPGAAWLGIGMLAMMGTYRRLRRSR